MPAVPTWGSLGDIVPTLDVDRPRCTVVAQDVLTVMSHTQHYDTSTSTVMAASQCGDTWRVVYIHGGAIPPRILQDRPERVHVTGSSDPLHAARVGEVTSLWRLQAMQSMYC